MSMQIALALKELRRIKEMLIKNQKEPVEIEPIQQNNFCNIEDMITDMGIEGLSFEIMLHLITDHKLISVTTQIQKDEFRHSVVKAITAYIASHNKDKDGGNDILSLNKEVKSNTAQLDISPLQKGKDKLGKLINESEVVKLSHKIKDMFFNEIKISKPDAFYTEQDIAVRLIETIDIYIKDFDKENN